MKEICRGGSSWTKKNRETRQNKTLWMKELSQEPKTREALPSTQSVCLMIILQKVDFCNKKMKSPNYEPWCDQRTWTQGLTVSSTWLVETNVLAQKYLFIQFTTQTLMEMEFWEFREIALVQELIKFTKLEELLLHIHSSPIDLKTHKETLLHTCPPTNQEIRLEMQGTEERLQDQVDNQCKILQLIHK